MGVTTECLLEINTSNEPQKWGFPPQVSEDILSCFQLNNINIVGLMTVGPNTKFQRDIRKSFILLRDLQNKINKELGQNLLIHLSMGMTGDYEIGVEEGSTMTVSYTHLRAHETDSYLVCRLLLEKKKNSMQSSA